jgi:hypothetical protein
LIWEISSPWIVESSMGEVVELVGVIWVRPRKEP